MYFALERRVKHRRPSAVALDRDCDSFSRDCLSQVAALVRLAEIDLAGPRLPRPVEGQPAILALFLAMTKPIVHVTASTIAELNLSSLTPLFLRV